MTIGRIICELCTLLSEKLQDLLLSLQDLQLTHIDTVQRRECFVIGFRAQVLSSGNDPLPNKQNWRQPARRGAWRRALAACRCGQSLVSFFTAARTAAACRCPYHQQCLGEWTAISPCRGRTRAVMRCAADRPPQARPASAVSGLGSGCPESGGSGRSPRSGPTSGS